MEYIEQMRDGLLAELVKIAQENNNTISDYDVFALIEKYHLEMDESDAILIQLKKLGIELVESGPEDVNIGSDRDYIDIVGIDDRFVCI